MLDALTARRPLHLSVVPPIVTPSPQVDGHRPARDGVNLTRSGDVQTHERRVRCRMTPNSSHAHATTQTDTRGSNRTLVTHPTVSLVTERRAAHIAVAPGFYDLDIMEQREVWDRAHDMAYERGWVPVGEEACTDLSVEDEDGTERYPLAPLCRLMGGPCAAECRS